MKKSRAGIEQAGINTEDLTPARKWIKELAGTPTYIGSALLAVQYTGGSFAIGTLVFLCFLMIYHFIYQHLFPRFDTTGKKGRLALFVVAQTAFWVSTFGVLITINRWS